MRVLYGIQGTGNGHISRARAIIPELRKVAHVDTLLSGHATELPLPGGVTYRSRGLGFSFGKTGGINYFDSMMKSRPVSFLQDIRDLPVERYDLIITDFEPVTAWAARRKGVPCIGVSHQASFLCEDVPRPPKRQAFGETLFRHYAPVDNAIGFHYTAYHDHILTPVVREEVRILEPSEDGHVTVYLPAYGHQKLTALLEKVESEVHLFSKHTRKELRYGNVWVRPVSGHAYLESLRGCSALVCGAGFEAPSEALYLGKRLMCVPMKRQYEQHCNAAALSTLGVTIVDEVDETLNLQISALLQKAAPNPVPYPDLLPCISEKIFNLAAWVIPAEGCKRPVT